MRVIVNKKKIIYKQSFHNKSHSVPMRRRGRNERVRERERAHKKTTVFFNVHSSG